MKKTTRSLLNTVTIGFCAFLSITGTSCHKSPQNSSITYVNDTYTPITISVNGSTQVIPVNATVTYIGHTGSTVNVTAYTAGTTAGGSVIGDTYNWSFTDYFPNDGGANVNEGLDVDATYFFLFVVNTSGSATTSLSVNYGLQSQTTDNISIPADGNKYSTGYYLGFSNTEVGAQLGNGDLLVTSPLSIPYVVNASATAFIHY